MACKPAMTRPLIEKIKYGDKIEPHQGNGERLIGWGESRGDDAPHERFGEQNDGHRSNARDDEGQIEDTREESPRLGATLAIDGLPQDGNESNSESAAGKEGRKIVRDVVGGPEDPHPLEANDLVEEKGLAERQDLVGCEEEAQQQRGAGEECEPPHSLQHALVLTAIHHHHRAGHVRGSR